MSTQRDFETMTDAELAGYQYAHRDDPFRAAADLEEVEVEVAHPLSVSMSFRLPPPETSAIRAAAEQAGMSVSDWIRGVCSVAAGKAV
ncbi:MAG: plasmid mobilization protein [Pseudonocardiaceae bacterium]